MQLEEQLLPHDEVHPDEQPLPHDDEQPLPHDDEQPLPHDDEQPLPHDDEQPLPHDDEQPLPHDDVQPLPHDDVQLLPHDDEQPLSHDEEHPLLQYEQDPPFKISSSLSQDEKNKEPKDTRPIIGSTFLADFLKNSLRDWSSSFLFFFMTLEANNTLLHSPK